MKAAIYLRVSDRHGRQDEANQEPDCAQLCAARGWDPVWYRERESGVKDRPVWRSVLEAARVGQVRAVVIWSLDRIGRTRVQIAHDLAELFRWKVSVSSVREPWLAEAGPFRDLLIQIMGWVAEGERQRLIERTNAGIARARAKGKRLGRPPRLAAAAIDHAAVTRLRGWSWSMVAADLEAAGYGRHTRGSIERALSRRGSAERQSKPGPDAGLPPRRTPASN